MPLLRLRNRRLLSLMEILAAPYSVFRRVLPQVATLGVLIYISGYIYISYQHLDLISALYAAVSLVTTIGAYAPSLSEMSAAEKLVLTVVMVAAVSVYASAAVTIINTVSNRQTWRDARARWRGSHVKDHTLIVGDKPDVAHAASKLESMREEYVVLTSKSEMLGPLPASRVILGDPLDERELKAAGADAARVVIVMMSEDDDGLAVLLRTRRLNPDARVLVEVNDDSMRDVFEAAGAELVVSPHRLAGRVLASVAISGNIGGFMLETKGLGELSIGFFRVAKGSRLEGRPISELPKGLIPLLVGRGNEPPTPYFTRDYVLQAGTLLVVMGDPKLFAGLRELLETPRS
ncbi:potassium channel family protein [Conexivisphaera calida]|uniref:Potassium channel protein n=1 Tax=Conexivisphaera calida TaxID=1874277 RepID=A0A4P2VDE5_9ARCH|nr:NAD-binding protein [Conexivisphaera calida]BBE42584.1 Potassium channel protein [Conexivisphaera calida]